MIRAMNTYHGILSVRPANTGSRSEGRYAYLIDDEGIERKLCRKNGAPFDDPFFEPFDGRRVDIAGTLRLGWLVVETIDPAPAEPTEEAPAEEEDPVTDGTPAKDGAPAEEGVPDEEKDPAKEGETAEEGETTEEEDPAMDGETTRISDETNTEKP